MKQIIFYIIFLSSIPVFAGDKNLLLGKWRWDSQDCKKVDFVFSPNIIVHQTDGDGSAIVFSFKKIHYIVNKETISVDFGQPHGLGKSKSPTAMSFKVIDSDHMVMDRKKGLKDLFRCK